MAENTQENKETKKKIEVSEELLQQLMESAKKTQVLQEQIEALQKNAVAQDTNNPRILKTPKGKEIGIRKYQKKYVIGWQNKGEENSPEYVYQEYDDQRKEFVDYIDLIFLNEKKPVKTNYAHYFRNSSKEFFKVEKEIENEPIIREDGYVQKKELADNGFGVMLTDTFVPLESVIKTKTFIININGQEVEIHEQFVG